jgi:hypothetical protein
MLFIKRTRNEIVFLNDRLKWVSERVTGNRVMINQDMEENKAAVEYHISAINNELYIPYILKYKPHPNLNRTQVLAIS